MSSANDKQFETITFCSHSVYQCRLRSNRPRSTSMQYYTLHVSITSNPLTPTVAI